jgi:NAD(P)-dependent dehydrogenase (short-subunit alcohol dehydrogenase family)
LGAYRYQINPASPDDYRRLLAALSADGLQPTSILHLWTYGPVKTISTLESLQEAQSHGHYSLLFLVQALAALRSADDSVNLTVVGSHIQPVLPDDEVAYAHSTSLGLIRMIPQELAWLACRHIDLDLEPNEANAEHIVQELNTLGAESEIAYRNGERWEPHLETVDWQANPPAALPFKRGGIYLLTGGLGGIGVVVARYLLTHFAARLLLVGRSPLSEKGDLYESLAQLDGDVIYAAADSGDLAAMRQIVEEAKAHWGGELDGVLHLAGSFQERMLTEETQENMAAMLWPKVAGAWTLHQLLQENAGALFIHFSSVNGFFGGAMLGAVVSGNAFLDVFAHFQRQQCGMQSYCFDWSLWDETGMAQGYQMKRLAIANGYRAMSPDQGIHSMIAALAHRQHHLLIGLDGANLHIRPHVAKRAKNLQKLCAYFTSELRVDMSELKRIAVADRFQTPSRCDFVQTPELPHTQDGSVDKSRLTHLAAQNGSITDGQGHEEVVTPRNEIEVGVAGIWQHVLHAGAVNSSDNFFELGGNSLLAAQCISRLRTAFGVEISVRHFFEAPTVADLASEVGMLLAAKSLQEANELSGEEREEDAV